MSGEHVRAKAGVATAGATAHGPAKVRRTRVIEEDAHLPYPEGGRAWTYVDPQAAIEHGIRELVRKEQRVTKAALAVELGVDYSTLRRWFDKLHLPSPAEIARTLPR